ncbi:HAD-IA family hydrolase [Amaricoccus macauensis]|uniref:HAD-IA family hydrolase n=1 Tax=Amaricoccus macauensis TaxID=57001 RepID=UPI003C7DE830
MSIPRLVIFDMDGTIIDSQQEILAAMSSAFTLAGHPQPTREAVLSIVGLSLPEAMMTLAPYLSEAQALELAELYKHSFLSMKAEDGNKPMPLYPGVIETLDALAADPWTTMGIATGKARRGLDRVFSVHDLAGYFMTLQTADNHPSKPHPSMVLEAMREAGCAPEQTVMVGDTEFDMVMAREAGARTVGVSWGYHPRERLAAAGADVIIDSYSELPGSLAMLWKAVG